MQDWLVAQLAAGLPAFQGSIVEGTLAVDQALLNQLLAAVLTQTKREVSGPPAVDHQVLLSKVSAASIRLEAGRLLIDFKAQV